MLSSKVIYQQKQQVTIFSLFMILNHLLHRHCLLLYLSLLSFCPSYSIFSFNIKVFLSVLFFSSSSLLIIPPPFSASDFVLYSHLFSSSLCGFRLSHPPLLLLSKHGGDSSRTPRPSPPPEATPGRWWSS